MNERGLSLIELIIVVSIIIILVVAAGITIPGLVGKYNIENQVKAMQTDLMSARIRAMENNRMHFVVIAANNYQVFEDTNENGVLNAGAGDDAAPGYTNPKNFLPYHGIGGSWTGTVEMNTRGIIEPVGQPLGATIWFNLGALEPEYDCIAISRTRINIGRWNGASCVQR